MEPLIRNSPTVALVISSMLLISSHTQKAYADGGVLETLKSMVGLNKCRVKMKNLLSSVVTIKSTYENCHEEFNPITGILGLCEKEKEYHLTYYTYDGIKPYGVVFFYGQPFDPLPQEQFDYLVTNICPDSFIDGYRLKKQEGDSKSKLEYTLINANFEVLAKIESTFKSITVIFTEKKKYQFLSDVPCSWNLRLEPVKTLMYESKCSNGFLPVKDISLELFTKAFLEMAIIKLHQSKQLISPLVDCVKTNDFQKLELTSSCLKEFNALVRMAPLLASLPNYHPKSDTKLYCGTLDQIFLENIHIIHNKFISDFDKYTYRAFEEAKSQSKEAYEDLQAYKKLLSKPDYFKSIYSAIGVMSHACNKP